MNVLALTLLISLVLAGIFFVCFAFEILKPKKTSLEHTSLLPLDDEPTPATTPAIAPKSEANPPN